MDNTKLAYFAGLIDGEGCICIKRVAARSIKDPKNNWERRRSPTYTWSLAIVMCDPRPIRAFCEFFGLEPHRTNSRQRYKPHHRPVFTAQVGGKRGIAILAALLPYLIVKREEAELAIRFHEEAVAAHSNLAIGRNRKPTPQFVLDLRHRFYEQMRQFKTRSYDTIDWLIP